MLRYSLTQLLMAVALLAILVAFSQSEGCGRRFSSVECVAFSPNGSTLVASRLDARDARTPFKCYKADVSRTISLIDATNGSTVRVLKRDLKRGNQGPAFGLWQFNRTSVVYPSEGSVVAHEFGGGPLTIYPTVADQAPHTLDATSDDACNIAASHDGSNVAASGRHEVSVVKIGAAEVVERWNTDHDIPFLGASLLSFSFDGSQLAVADAQGVHLWRLDSIGSGSSTVVAGNACTIDAMAFLPDGSLIVASEEWLRQYDQLGNIVRSFSESTRCLHCVASSDGTRIAAASFKASGGSCVDVYDMHSGNLLRTLALDCPTSMVFAPGTANLVVGDYQGTLKLVDTMSGRMLWQQTITGQHRWPWTVPVTVLLVWSYFVHRLSQKGRST